MTPVAPGRGAVALIGELEPAERLQWIDSLRSVLPDEQVVADPEELRALSTSIEVAVVANPPHGSLVGLSALRLVQSLWVGVDRLLTDPHLPQVPIARLVDPTMTQSMTASVVGHVLHLHLQHHRYRASQQRRRWEPSEQPTVSERRVGVLGLGELGTAAARALAGLGFTVTGWSRSPKHVAGVSCVAGPSGFTSVLGSSQILVNLLPLTADTAGLIDADALATLPIGAAFVNLGRGAHVDETALLSALDSGHVEQAILDVFSEEPLRADHRFWTHPSVTVLPHVAAQTSIASASAVVAANIRALRAGRPLQHLVDRKRGY